MRFLGLQPRVLSPLESSERNGGLPGRLSEQTAIARVRRSSTIPACSRSTAIG
jgi:hypothetical protein